MNKDNITREEVVEAENKLSAAQLISDVHTLEQLLYDDLVGVAPTGEILTKEMDLDSHRAGTMIIEEASTEIEEIKITGNIAITIVSMKAKGKVMDKPLEGHFRYLRVWKRFDNTLKIVGASFIQLS